MNIAVLGYGTVGSGVVEVLERNKALVAKKAGEEINVKYVLDLRDFPGDPIQEKVVHDYEVILKDDDIKIVVEVMGGVQPAYTFVKQALEAGKSAATSNKELVAKHGAELLAIAKEHDVNFMFEASVGGGIPIIRPLLNCITADVVEEVSGILNGTTNYMLTKMSAEGTAYDVVLKDAQDKGYAERHPEADVEGYDACRKIAILTSLVYGQQVDFEDIYTEGITKISDTDFKYTKAMGTSIKLLATSKNVDGSVYAMVSPMMLSKEHPLTGVNDVFNAVFVKGNMLGDTMFYGKGAGKLPTASAVVSDIVDEVRHISGNVPVEWKQDKLALSDMKQAVHRFFVRVPAEVEKSEVEALFGHVDYVTVEGLDTEYAFVTETLVEADFDEKAEKMPAIITRIRCNL